MNVCPVTVRGKTYPSVRAAAQAEGVAPRTCYRHLRAYGHLDLLGRVENRPPDRSKPVVVAGVRYPSITTAAKVLGWAPKTVRKRRDP
jgi:hypothetical protein